MVVQQVDNRPGEDDAEASPDGGERRQRPHCAGHFPGRELIPDDAESDGHHPAANALDHPGHDQHADRGRDRRQRRAHGQGDEGGDEDPFLADHVAHPAEDRRHHRRRQQVGGQHPGDGSLGRMQLVLHRR